MRSKLRGKKDDLTYTLVSVDNPFNYSTIFELDEEEFSNDLQQNMRALGEFQQ